MFFDQKTAKKGQNSQNLVFFAKYIQRPFRFPKHSSNGPQTAENESKVVKNTFIYIFSMSASVLAKIDSYLILAPRGLKICKNPFGNQFV